MWVEWVKVTNKLENHTSSNPGARGIFNFNINSVLEKKRYSRKSRKGRKKYDHII